MDFSKVTTAVEELTSKVGIETATSKTQQVYSKFFGSSEGILTAITSKLSSIVGGVSSGLTQAAKKTGNNKYAAITASIGKVLQYAPMVKAIGEIIQVLGTIIEKLQKEVEALTAGAEERSCDVTHKEVKEFSKMQVDQWRQGITELVTCKISNEIIKPLASSLGNELVFAIGRRIKQTYASYRDSQHTETFKDMKEKYEAEQNSLRAANASQTVMENSQNAYHEELTKLMINCREPALFASIIREGVPVGIHCTQAMAEVLGRPIVITVNDGSSSFPTEFTPESGADQNPIRLEFVPGVGGTAGHFVDPSSPGDIAGAGGDANANNCLFDAIRSACGETITRDHIANKIETNDRLQHHVKKGFHEHFLKKGALGGVTRTNKAEHRIKSAGQFIVAGDATKDKGWRDDPNVTDNAKKRTGNHELISIKALRACAKLDAQCNSEETYSYKDASEHLRVDTRMVLFEAPDGGLAGHQHSVFGNVEFVQTVDGKEMVRFSGGKSTGSKIYHNGLSDVLRECKSPREAVVMTLAKHLQTTLSGDQLRQMTFNSDHYVTSGHNMRYEAQRKEVASVIDAERYKMALTLLKANGGGNKLPGGTRFTMPKKPANYEAIQQRVNGGIKDANDIKGIGCVLMKPEPYATTKLDRRMRNAQPWISQKGKLSDASYPNKRMK